MTKARLHPSLLEFNGAMGDMVFKKRGKKVYVSIKPEDIRVNLERQDNLEVLQVKIELPEAARG